MNWYPVIPLDKALAREITAHWAPTCSMLWLRIASPFTLTLSSVFGTIVRLQHTLVSRVRFVMDTHLRRLLGRHNCTVVLLLEPGSNTLGKCVFLANMRQRLPSTNSVHGGHKPMLKHSNSVWTQALQVKHKSETLESCLNTSTRLKQKSEPLKVCLDTVRLLNPSDHPALQRHSTFSFCL